MNAPSQITARLTACRLAIIYFQNRTKSALRFNHLLSRVLVVATEQAPLHLFRGIERCFPLYQIGMKIFFIVFDVARFNFVNVSFENALNIGKVQFR